MLSYFHYPRIHAKAKIFLTQTAKSQKLSITEIQSAQEKHLSTFKHPVSHIYLNNVPENA